MESVVLLTSRNHVLMFKAVFMGSLSGWVVVHPHFTVVAPKHGVGFPELQPRTIAGVHAYTTNSMHTGLPQSFLLS